jgi:hypothetical protein
MDTNELIQLLQLVNNKEVGNKVKAAVQSVHTGQLITQPGGMFSTVGLETDVLSTHVTPRGIGRSLPVFTSFLTDPRYPVFTGWGAKVGSRPTGVCDDGPTSFANATVLTAQFGRIQQDSNTIDSNNLLDQARGVNTNLQLLGQVYGDAAPFMPNQGSNTSQMLNLVVLSEMVGIGVQFERDFASLTWQGTPANNTSGGGHKEFPGLDSQIATGQVDAESNVAVPALDSTIIDYNFAAVDGTLKDIVSDMLSTENYLFHRAERSGMAPVTWKIVMRPELWYELSAIWPCRYNTNRCTNIGGTNPVVINDNYNVIQRDAIRKGMTLDLNGRTYEVETDDGIYEYNNQNSASVAAGSFASAIYFVPIKVRGNFPVLYWEAKDYRQIDGQMSPLGLGLRNLEFWTDGGRFHWGIESVKAWCFKFKAKTEPRLILRTPHLAAKIQKVKYTPAKHMISYDPASPYHLAGGVSLRGVPTPGYAVWR